jgi:MFS family permease
MGAEAAAASGYVVSRRRWLVWGVLSAALFLSFFHRVAPAVVADRLMAEFGVGATVLGSLAAIYFYVYLAMQIPTGALADTLGPRKTVAASSLLAAAGALLFAVAPGLPGAFVGRFLVGLGTAVAFICVLKVVTTWFRPTEFGTLTGLGSIVTTAGGAAAATPLAAAAEAFGWRPAFAVTAALSVVVAGLTWWLVRDRPAEAVDPRATAHASADLPFRRAALLVWGNRQTWLSFLGHFGWFGSYLVFISLWGVPYLMHVHELDRLAAANVMIGASVFYTVGALGLGVISDRWLQRRKPPMLVAGVIFLALWIGLVLWPCGRPPLALAVVMIYLACAASAANLLCFALAKELNAPAAAGLAMASANGGILCTALLQPLIGYVLDLHWRGAMVAGARVYDAVAYQWGFAAFIVCGVIALAGSWLVRESHCQNVWKGDG